MKKIIVCVVALSFTFFTMQPQEDESTTRDADLKAKIFRRLYLIQRLENPIKTLSTHTNAINCPSLEPSLFNCTRIKTTVAKLCKEQSVRCIKNIFRSFLSYRHLEDPTFEKDAIKLITMLYISVTGKAPDMPHDPAHQKNQKIFAPLSADQLNSFSDLVTSSLDQVNPDDVALRWYYVQRMKSSMNWLKSYHRTLEKKPIIIDQNDPLNSPRIKKIMLATRSENPIATALKLWDDFKKFKFVQDYLMTQEFITFVLFIFKNIYINSPAQAAVPYEALVDLHSQLENLPVEDLLQIVDDLADNVMEATNQEPTTQFGKVTAWVKKNWWFPACTIGYLAVKIYQRYKPTAPVWPPHNPAASKPAEQTGSGLPPRPVNPKNPRPFQRTESTLY